MKDPKDGKTKAKQLCTILYHWFLAGGLIITDESTFSRSIFVQYKFWRSAIVVD